MLDEILVPGRQCGDCTECCHALLVEAPTLSKPSGVTCPNSCGSGCAVYVDRPQACRDWYCAWRLSETLADDWRPDRSGFIVEIMLDDIPTGFSTPGIRFTMLRSMVDLLWPPFVDLVTKAIVIRQPVFLCLVGPPGCLAASSFLNIPAFVAAVDAEDKDAIHRGLEQARERLEMHHWERKSA